MPPPPPPCSPEGRGGGGGSGTDWAAEKGGVAWTKGAGPEDLEWLDTEVGDICSRVGSDPGSVGSGCADCCMLQAESGVVSALAVWTKESKPSRSAFTK